jgi:RNA polymerase sigma-70 factor (ECF subfamily)
MEETSVKKKRVVYFKREGPKSTSNEFYEKSPKVVNMTYDFTFLPEEEIQSYISYMKRWSFKTFGYYNDDLIVDALLKAFSFAHQYDETKSSKKTWLIAILRNEIRQNMKINKRISYLSIDKEYGDDKVTLKEKLSDTISDDLTDYLTENYNDILQLVETHPELRLLQLLVAGKYTYIEMSEKLNIPLGTLKSRIHSQRKKLRKMLKR